MRIEDCGVRIGDCGMKEINMRKEDLKDRTKTFCAPYSENG